MSHLAPVGGMHLDCIVEDPRRLARVSPAFDLELTSLECVIGFEEMLDRAQLLFIERAQLLEPCGVDGSIGDADEAVVADALAALALLGTQHADEPYGHETPGKAGR